MTNIAREILFETSSQILEATEFLNISDQEIINLFAEYEQAQSTFEKQETVEVICKTLMINMQIEEEIFHSVLKTALKEK